MNECEELNSYTIEGRWFWGYGFNSTPSTMYELLDGIMYTYYCDNLDCDSTYWNSVDTSDALPNSDSYSFINDTLTVNEGPGTLVNFECNGNIVLFGNNTYSYWWRVGLDTADCEGLQLELSSAITSPETFRLHQNYPNPFNPVTTLQYDLPENANVNITIYDMMGRQVKTLVNGSQTAGYRSIQWNANNDRNEPVSAGLYLYSIAAGNFRQTKKMILLK